MSHLVGKLHCIDKATVARLNTAVVFGLVGAGLACCALGAMVYDVGRWFSAW